MVGDPLNRSTAAALAALLSAMAGGVTAAEEQGIAYIARVSGSVLVNQGQQYRDGTEGQVLETGDRVMSLSDSSAILQFRDGCRYTMKEDELVTIPSLSPCVFSKGPADRMSVAALPPVPPSTPPIVPLAPINLGWLPAAIAGGLTLGAILEDGDDYTRPLPPISP